MVVSGGPDLGDGDMAQRRNRFREAHDAWRRAIVNEPRGSDVLVGALLCAPVDAASTCGVIFFNNVGYIGMCGHGTIGLIATLAYLGRVQAGEHRIETPVGTVTATLHADGTVTVANVPSFRYAAQIGVNIPGHGVVHGDVAWGGNWFFLCGDHGLSLEAGRVGELSAFAQRVRDALRQQGVTGLAGAEIDHIELVGAAGRSAQQCAQLRALPGRRLRPFALRHGNERQARVPRRRRQALSGSAVAAGERDRQRVHGPLRAPDGGPSGCASERGAAADPRSRARHARRNADLRSRGRVRVGTCLTSA